MKTALLAILGILALLAAVVSVYFIILGKRSQAMEPLQLNENAFTPCPDKPNCVSSTAPDAQHHVAPLATFGDRENTERNLEEALKAMGITLLDRNGSFWRATARSSLFGFVDDVQFLLPEQSGEPIQVRSSSRVGHSDLGANRKRVEALRARLEIAPVNPKTPE